MAENCNDTKNDQKFIWHPSKKTFTPRILPNLIFVSKSSKNYLKEEGNFKSNIWKTFFFQNLIFSLRMFEIEKFIRSIKIRIYHFSVWTEKKKKKYSFARKKKWMHVSSPPLSRISSLWSCVLVLSGTEMSMYFFRLHNLRRQAEEVRKKRQKGKPSQSGQRGTNTDQSQPTAGSMHCCNKVHRGPSRLFERAPLQPSDSLDEIAFQIPR